MVILIFPHRDRFGTERKVGTEAEFIRSVNMYGVEKYQIRYPDGVGEYLSPSECEVIDADRQKG